MLRAVEGRSLQNFVGNLIVGSNPTLALEDKLFPLLKVKDTYSKSIYNIKRNWKKMFNENYSS